MRIAVSMIVAVAAGLIFAPAGSAEPCGADCGNPYFDPNNPNNAQFLSAVRAAGISEAPHGLISGAINTVCPGLDGGQSFQSIAGTLERYSRYTPEQAYTYIVQAVTHYCPSDAGKLP